MLRYENWQAAIHINCVKSAAVPNSASMGPGLNLTSLSAVFNKRRQFLHIIRRNYFQPHQECPWQVLLACLYIKRIKLIII